jgi:tetratricopeptide (TPR) repeat protein
VSQATVTDPTLDSPADSNLEAPFLPPAVEQWLRKHSVAIGIALFLVAATFAIYAQTLGFDFVSYDDGQYVYENQHVKQGISLDSLSWAFTSFHSSNWHPLTWLSHMLDWSVFGSWAGGHHLTNVLLHAAGSVVLFLALRRLTGATWRSGLVAALFCMHPLHVESVAWVSERKDVLAGLFFGLTLWSYAAYAEQAFSWLRYLRVVAVFGLGLLCKPTLVTAPFVLLLLDYWPLGRLTGSREQGAESGEQVAGSGVGRASSPWMLLMEKLPLFALSTASCIVTYVAQATTGAVSITSAPIIPLQTAVVGYARYIAMFIWPFRLTMHYQRDREVYLAATVACAAAIIIVTSVLFYFCRQRQRYLLVGWLWFLGTLVPVSGIIPVGDLSVADRYSYLSFTGLFIALVWGVADFAQQIRILPSANRVATGRRPVTFPVPFVVLAAAVLAFFGIRSFQQTRIWQDSETLFRQAVAIFPNDSLAHSNHGKFLENQHKQQEAEAEYQVALRLDASDCQAHNSLGVIERRRGNLNKAIEHYLAALNDKPDFALAHSNLAVAYAEQGRTAEAEQECVLALRFDPELADAENNLGNALASQGRWTEAIAHYRRAIELSPDRSNDHFNLGMALFMVKSSDEGVAECKKAIELDPGNLDARLGLAKWYASSGNIGEALNQWYEVLKRHPGDLQAAKGIGITLVIVHHGAEALPFLQTALAADPKDRETRTIKAEALTEAGHPAEAIAECREVIRGDPKNVHANKALAAALLATGEGARAIEPLTVILSDAPNDLEALQLMVFARLGAKQIPEALADFRKIHRKDPKNKFVLDGLTKIIASKPNMGYVRSFLAYALLEAKQTKAALAAFREVLQHDAKNCDALNSIAWIEACHPDAKFRDGKDAVAMAEKAAEMRRDDASTLDTLAAAYAEAGRFQDAVSAAQKAIEAGKRINNQAVIEGIEGRLKLYQAGKPNRDAALSE